MNVYRIKTQIPNFILVIGILWILLALETSAQELLGEMGSIVSKKDVGSPLNGDFFRYDPVRTFKAGEEVAALFSKDGARSIATSTMRIAGREKRFPVIALWTDSKGQSSTLLLGHILFFNSLLSGTVVKDGPYHIVAHRFIIRNEVIAVYLVGDNDTIFALESVTGKSNYGKVPAVLISKKPIVQAEKDGSAWMNFWRKFIEP